MKFRPLVVVLISTMQLFSAVPSVDWLRLCGGPGSTYAWDVAVDAEGNACIAGLLQSTNAQFSSNTVVGPSSAQFFAAKFNRNGSNLWVRNAVIGQAFGARGVRLNDAGDVFVAGVFRGSMSFGTTNITAVGIQDLFLIKYDSNGTFQWVRQARDPLGSVLYELPRLALRGTNVYVAVQCRSAIRATDVLLTNTHLALLVYDFEGNVLRTGNLGFSNNGDGNRPVAHGMAIDEEGSVYVASEFSSSMLSLGSTNITRQGTGSSGLLTKWDSDGNLVWHQQTGGGTYATLRSVALTPEGNVAVCGRTTAAGSFAGFPVADAFISQLTPQGTALWLTALSNGVDASCVAASLTGDLTLSGSINAGDDVPFAASFSPSGQPRWTLAAVTQPNPFGRWSPAFACASDQSGAIYLAGRSWPAVQMGGVYATNRGTVDAFLLRIQPEPPALKIAPQATTNIVLSWPTNRLGFRLMRSATLDGKWIESPSAERLGSAFVVTQSIRPDAEFFKLSAD